MTASRWRNGASILVAGALLGACGSDKPPASGITLETLAAATGTACPLPLDVVASTSGVDSSTPAVGSVVDGRLADSGSVAVLPSTDEVVDGVSVSCRLALSDGGEVELLLVAGKTGDAGVTVVPAAAHAADLNTDQSEQLANDVARTKVGVLVPVPGTKSVAVMPTKVHGASTAAILLSSEQLSRGQVEQLARQLDQRLR